MNSLSDFKTEIKLLLIVAGISSILALGAIWLLKETKVIPSASLPVGQEVTITGTITEGRTECYRDGVCSYALESDMGKIEVIWNIGWTCLNDPFFEGDSVDIGSNVEVFGIVESPKTILACSAPEYYIKSLGFQALQQSTIDTSNWQTYRNGEFGFEIKYPSNWDVAEFLEGDPIINVYKKDQEQTPLFTYHTNATHVSVFPRGFGSEPPKTLVLSDGTRFGQLIIKREDTPDSWLESGFVFWRVYVQDISTSCERDGQIIEMSQCEYYSSDRFIVDGVIDEADQKMVQQILSTFRFVEPTDMSDWETYQNDLYGFEFKHPAQGFVSKVIPAQSSLEVYLEAFNKSRTSDHIEFDPVVILAKKDVQAEEYKGIQYETAQPAAPTVNIETYIQLESGEIVRLVTWAVDARSVTSEMRQLHNQILSTFRLIDDKYTPVKVGEVINYASINKNNFVKTTGRIVELEYSNLGGSILLSNDSAEYVFAAICHACVAKFMDFLNTLKLGDVIEVKGIAHKTAPADSNLESKFSLNVQLPDLIGMIDVEVMTLEK